MVVHISDCTLTLVREYRRGGSSTKHRRVIIAMITARAYWGLFRKLGQEANDGKILHLHWVFLTIHLDNADS